MSTHTFRHSPSSQTRTFIWVIRYVSSPTFPHTQHLLHPRHLTSTATPPDSSPCPFPTSRPVPQPDVPSYTPRPLPAFCPWPCSDLKTIRLHPFERVIWVRATLAAGPDTSQELNQPLDAVSRTGLKVPGVSLRPRIIIREGRGRQLSPLRDICPEWIKWLL